MRTAFGLRDYYTIEMVIKRGNTVVYGQSSSQGCPTSATGFPYIEVSGTTATSCRGDSSVSVNGWFAMPGDANDDQVRHRVP